MKRIANDESWYKNPSCLLDYPEEFIPKKNDSMVRKSNSLARLAIYIGLIVILSGSNQKYLSVSILLLLISLFVNETESFAQSINDANQNEKCTMPTEDNPYMNFTLKDYYENPNRPKNCDIKKVRSKMRNEFLKRILPDPADLWGQNISDRNFYTMPTTTLINDQTEFANFCYENMGQCKAFGKDCLKRALSTSSLGAFQAIN